LRRSVYRNISRVQKFATQATNTGSSPPAPPPPPPPQKGGSGGVWIAGALGLAGAAYYFQDDLIALFREKKAEVPAKTIAPQSTSNPQTASEKPKETPSIPEKAAEPKLGKSELDNLEKKLVESAAPKKSKSGVDWKELRARVVDRMDDSDWDDGSWGPIFVRLAWHAAGTYDKNTKLGGSDGALMRFKPQSEWGANAGLANARAKLEPLKREFPDISFADLWSFAGTVAIEEMGGPKMNWRPGRKDVQEIPKDPLPDGLLPDADGRDKKSNPAEHVRDIFYRMGFNDREAVALSGAHALGRCHETSSGYWGPWTRAPTTFSNEYFRLLIEEKWTPKKLHKGQPWKGPLQYEDKTGELMMIPTDIALIQDPKFRPIVEEFAKDEKKFFAEFGQAWIKLQELGVREFRPRRYYFFGPRE